MYRGDNTQVSYNWRYIYTYFIIVNYSWIKDDDINDTYNLYITVEKKTYTHANQYHLPIYLRVGKIQTGHIQYAFSRLTIGTYLTDLFEIKYKYS